MKKILRAATAALLSGGVGVVGSGLASGVADAEPIPAPMYHWCPGDFWDPAGGFNWDCGVCHDDWHRGDDGDWHDRDWHPDWDHDRERQPWWPH
jgi:hypothetical protein